MRGISSLLSGGLTRVWRGDVGAASRASLVIARSAATKQSSFCQPNTGLLRSARNDGGGIGCLPHHRANDSKPDREETQQREQQMSDASSHAAGWRPASHYPDPAI